jgi:acetyl esterase/lipase
VPHPRWVRVEDVTIPEKHISAASDALIAQLGRDGVRQIGGELWWRWRRPKSELKAQWIEMRGDYNVRKKKNEKGNRVMLYVHGGAYFFGSVDEHRYQMQRHARKLKAKVFAPRYRLAPQFPFPCGLLDCLAAYLYLLTVHAPTEIILSGDSAGGGMVTSMLVVLRDRKLPLPTGAVLISPWVDLTHSFPSLAGDSHLDYIPAHGFMQRPSLSWPPPNEDEMVAMAKSAVGQVACEGLGNHLTRHQREDAGNAATQGFTFHHDENARSSKSDGVADSMFSDPKCEPTPQAGRNLSIMVDGKLIEIKDQIQMYACNHLIAHPVVSPVLTPSLGGLPPLLILTGGGELLRDEQIYLAHKAANPSKYPPSAAILDAYDPSRTQLNKYPPTDVQLQVWDDLCHVAPTLSFTRPAKFMYRSIAQFGAWSLARAQKTEIEILDDDDVSIISSGSDTESDTVSEMKPTHKEVSKDSSGAPVSQIGKAGDPLPHFRNHMIRQRVDRHGLVYPLAPASSLPACQMTPDEIGAIKPGPVCKWMAAKKEWDTKYASDRRRIQARRAKYMAAGGYETFDCNEVPPPSALAGRRRKGMDAEMEAKKTRRSWGMSMWSGWGSKHDKSTIEREEKADANPDVPLMTTTTMADSSGRMRSVTAPSSLQPPAEAAAATTRPSGARRSRSRRRTVTDVGQTDEHPDPDLLVTGDSDVPDQEDDTGDATRQRSATEPAQPSLLSPSYIPALSRNKRPDLAYEISASLSPARAAERNPSTAAILEASGTVSPLSNASDGDSVSLFDPMTVRPGQDKDRNASAVAIVEHDGVCNHLDHKHEGESGAHDVRYDPLGSGRDNASTMAVAEGQGIGGMERDDSVEGTRGVGMERDRSEAVSTVGTEMSMEKENEKEQEQQNGGADGAGDEDFDDDYDDEELFGYGGPKRKVTGGKSAKLLGMSAEDVRNSGTSNKGLGNESKGKGTDGADEDDEDDLMDVLAAVARANGRGRMQGQAWEKKKAKS